MLSLTTLKVITDTDGNIYAIQKRINTGYNVVKINKGSSIIDTIVNYNVDNKCYNIVTNANNELFIYGTEGAKIYKYKSKDQLELYCDLPNTASSATARLCYDADGILYVAKTVEKDIYKIENGVASLLANSTDYIFELTYHPNGEFYFIGRNTEVSKLSLTGQISSYATVDNVDATSILVDRHGKLLIIDKFGKLLKENDTKVFTEWMPSLLGGYKLYAMCYNPEGDLLLGSQELDAKLLKLIIE